MFLFLNGHVLTYNAGIGMTKNDLVKNLGTIAKSGTSEFFANANVPVLILSKLGNLMNRRSKVPIHRT